MCKLFVNISGRDLDIFELGQGTRLLCFGEMG